MVSFFWGGGLNMVTKDTSVKRVKERPQMPNKEASVKRVKVSTTTDAAAAAECGFCCALGKKLRESYAQIFLPSLSG